MVRVEAAGMEHGLAELSDALNALAASPDDPHTSPSGLIRLLRMMATLAEPDDALSPV